MSSDPYNFYKSLFKVWQKPAAEYWDSYLRSPLYLEPLKGMLDVSLETQRNLQDVGEAWWHAWGLPTRRDQEWIQHRLNEVDTQLKRLARRIEKLAK